MKQRGCDTMTCMITAYANIDTAIAATRQGIDFFLPKPFSPDDLLGVVETLVRHKQPQEAERLRARERGEPARAGDEKSQTHSLVASLRDAVLVVNRDGEVVLANQAMADAARAAARRACCSGRRRSARRRRPGRRCCELLAAPAEDRTVRQLDLGDESSWPASSPSTARTARRWAASSP